VREVLRLIAMVSIRFYREECAMRRSSPSPRRPAGASWGFCAGPAGG
jgi:hypothetical protein